MLETMASVSNVRNEMVKTEEQVAALDRESARIAAGTRRRYCSRSIPSAAGVGNSPWNSSP